MKIGVVIARIGGVDGVALETEKWIAVLERMGHSIHVLTGELEGAIAGWDEATTAAAVELQPELGLFHPCTSREQAVAFFGQPAEEVAFMAELEAQAALIEGGILGWIQRQQIELLIAENASALPCHLSLGLALYRVYAASGLPVVTHDHDFPWERGTRYASPFGGVNALVERCFPAKLPGVRHAVINSAAAQTLSQRLGIEDAVVVPNVMDFDRPYAQSDAVTAALPTDLGLAPGDLPLFQITRIVERKGIETAIELVHRLDDVAVKLVITGTATDDSEGYIGRLHALVDELNLQRRVIFAGDRFGAVRGVDDQGRRIYSIEDGYAAARACTYFSTYEGFGNAFVEAVVARRPIFVNNYEPVYWPDIGAKGFETVMIEGGLLTAAAVEQIHEVLNDPARAAQMVERNFELGREHFSYDALQRLLDGLVR